MDTSSFKTKTLFMERKNPFRKDNYWVIALDMGYSAVKGMSRNSLFCFPSYAKKLPQNSISLAKALRTDILYRDNEGSDVYAVGAKAEAMFSVETTNDNNTTLYGRNRYFSDIFRVTSRVGLAMALLSNQYGNPMGKEIVVQTGLPSAYLVDDLPLLKEALSDEYSFDIKIGNDPWKHFEFTLSEENIRGIQQPMGTLVSIATDRNGIPTMDAQRLFRSNMLVFDPGFRTGDTSYIKGGTINLEDCYTFDDLSMVEILSRTVDILQRDYNANITVPAMQNYLESGMVKAINKRAFQSTSIAFGDILQAQALAVCDLAIARLSEVYNYFAEVDYLTITGGTGAAWYEYIKERLKGLQTLTIISANRNEDLPYIFSNVRGYYMYLINRV